MKFTLSYTVHNRGWADAVLEGDGERYVIDGISYLSDAFTELSEAVLQLLQGCAESGCGFDHEPGRTKLRFVRAGTDVRIAVYVFEKELFDRPWDKGRCVLSFETRLARLKSQYLNVAERLLRDLGVNEYENSWGYPFPLRVYEQIKAA